MASARGWIATKTFIKLTVTGHHFGTKINYLDKIHLQPLFLEANDHRIKDISYLATDVDLRVGLFLTIKAPVPFFKPKATLHDLSKGKDILFRYPGPRQIRALNNF